MAPEAGGGAQGKWETAMGPQGREEGKWLNCLPSMSCIFVLGTLLQADTHSGI